MATTNTKKSFFSKSKIGLLVVCSAISLNAFAANTGWHLSSTTTNQRDIFVNTIDTAGANAFNSRYATLYPGATAIINNSYGNAGSIKLGLYDGANHNQAIGTLILTQADYTSKKPSSVPSSFGTSVSGGYDNCLRLEAKRVDSWVCYKFIPTTFTAYTKDSNYTVPETFILKAVNFSATQVSRTDHYGTVSLNLTISKTTATTTSTAATTSTSANTGRTIKDYGQWSATTYKVNWNPEVFPVVTYNNTKWIACSDASSTHVPGSTSSWTPWVQYTGNIKSDCNFSS